MTYYDRHRTDDPSAAPDENAAYVPIAAPRPYYILIDPNGRTVTECYHGYARGLDRARSFAERSHSHEGGVIEIHEGNLDAVLKIEAACALERELLESLRTGLGRKVRGA